MKKQSYLSISLLLASLLLFGCGEKPAAPHDHADEHQHGDGHGEHKNDEGEHPAHATDPTRATQKITHFAEQSELFVEFPSLVVGEASTFVAHLTWLKNFKPLTQGKVTVILTGAAGKEEFRIEQPSVSGIFKPVVTPKQAGKHSLILQVETEQGLLSHDLGQVEVFAKGAAIAPADELPGNAISFTKEQQWKIDFSTVTAVQKTVRESAWVTGSIKASANGEALFTAPAAGLIRANGAFPRVGQAVKKGQVLAYLSPRLGGETDYASLEADLAKTQLNLAQAKRERERLEGLFKDEAIAEKRVLEAITHEKLAQAEQAVAQKRLGQLSGGGGIALHAPMDGVIAAVSVAQGAFVNEATPLFHLVNNRVLWLEARLPESELGRLGTPAGAWFSVGDTAEGVRIESGKNGRLLAMGGVVDNVTRTIPVIFEFNPEKRHFPIGLNTKVQLYAGQGREGVLIPASAVQDESGTNVVYVQLEGEAFERRIVQTGVSDAELIEIKAGLQAGERVVAQGSYLIRLSTSKTEATGHVH